MPNQTLPCSTCASLDDADRCVECLKAEDVSVHEWVQAIGLLGIILAACAFVAFLQNL